jgi:hypothetical protein
MLYCLKNNKGNSLNMLNTNAGFFLSLFDLQLLNLQIQNPWIQRIDVQF